jgi:hypothetical protein
MVIRPTAIQHISTMSAALDVVTWLTISSQIIELNGNLSADTAAKLTPQTALATVTEPDHQRLVPLEQLVEAQLMRPLGRVTTMFPQPSLLEPMMSTTALETCLHSWKTSFISAELILVLAVTLLQLTNSTNDRIKDPLLWLSKLTYFPQKILTSITTELTVIIPPISHGEVDKKDQRTKLRSTDLVFSDSTESKFLTLTL